MAQKKFKYLTNPRSIGALRCPRPHRHAHALPDPAFSNLLPLAPNAGANA